MAATSFSELGRSSDLYVAVGMWSQTKEQVVSDRDGLKRKDGANVLAMPDLSGSIPD